MSIRRGLPLPLACTPKVSFFSGVQDIDCKGGPERGACARGESRPLSVGLWAHSTTRSVPGLVPGCRRSVFGPPHPGRPCFALQCNLCFCWKPSSCLSTASTRFIFRGLGLRGVPRARPGNKHRASLPKVNRLLAVFSLPLTLWATRLPGPPRAGVSFHPASGWGSAVGSGLSRPEQSRQTAPSSRAGQDIFPDPRGGFWPSCLL